LRIEPQGEADLPEPERQVFGLQKGLVLVMKRWEVVSLFFGSLVLVGGAISGCSSEKESAPGNGSEISGNPSKSGHNTGIPSSTGRSDLTNGRDEAQQNLTSASKPVGQQWASDFTSVENMSSVDMVYEQQAGPADVQVEGSPEDVAQIVLSAKDGKLLVETTPNAHLRGPVTVHAHSPNLVNFVLSGSGNSKLGHLKSKNLELHLVGSGQIQVGGEAGAIKVDLSGSGGVDLTSVASERLDVSLAGSGEVHAVPKLAAIVDLGGSGSVHVGSPSTLKVRIDGSGSVYYQGQPRIEQTINGSGGLQKE
jgi:hypothetical protein